MSGWLKQSTAATIKLGPFVDDTDGKTVESALTISQADIRLAKAGGDYAQTNNATGATHDENGYYDVPLDTTDTNTLGRLHVAVTESGALPVWAEYMILPAVVYDSLVAGTDNLQVDTTQVGGTTQTARDLGAQLDAAITTRLAPTVAGRTLDVSAGGEAGVDWANVGSPTTALDLSGTTISTSQAVASVSGAVGSVTADVGITQAAADKVWGSAARTLTSFGTLAADVTTAVWAAGTRTLTSFGTLAADIWAYATRTLSAFAFTVTTSDSADITAIKAKTDNLPASPAAVGSAMTLTTGERDSIATALLDMANGVETNLTVRQSLQLAGAALAGILSGAATAEVTIKAARNSGTTRITATVDADGNRSAITYNL